MSAKPFTPDLTGRVVLVTGAGRGLGRALVYALVRAGARVAGCARGEAELTALGQEIGADRLLVQPLDVTDAPAVGELVDRALERWGRIDGLINNASVLGARRPLREIEPADWRAVIDVNLTGAFIVSRAVLPAMRAAGSGSIVNVSSGVGDESREDWGGYAVSKWALEALSWNLALEERAAGIRVNVVDPGRMRTGMRQAAYPAEDPASVPDPAETTDVFLWLMDAASEATTGQRLRAQGWSAEDARGAESAPAAPTRKEAP